MKYLILLEGKTEQYFIDMLIEEGIFKIDVNDMIDMRPHHQRQLSTKFKPHLLTLIKQLQPEEKVEIIRIGDKMSDKLAIPKDIRNKIQSEKKYCTKPEFEILIIIDNDFYNEYLKVKSIQKPKTFIKEKLGKMVCNNKDENWIKSYFKDKNIYNLLEEYKKLSKHNKNELYLVDLVNK